MISVIDESEVRRGCIAIIYDRLNLLSSRERGSISTCIETVINFPTPVLLNLSKQPDILIKSYTSWDSIFSSLLEKARTGQFPTKPHKFEGYKFVIVRENKDAFSFYVLIDPQTQSQFILTESFKVEGKITQYEVEISLEEFWKLTEDFFNQEIIDAITPT